MTFLRPTHREVSTHLVDKLADGVDSLLTACLDRFEHVVRQLAQRDSSFPVPVSLSISSNFAWCDAADPLSQRTATYAKPNAMASMPLARVSKVLFSKHLSPKSGCRVPCGWRIGTIGPG